MQKFHLIATAAAGIEALVGKELRALGYETQVENGRVRFEGDLRDIMVANLWLRTADRVKIIVGEFDATDFDNLFEQTKALPWENPVQPYSKTLPAASLLAFPTQNKAGQD